MARTLSSASALEARPSIAAAAGASAPFLLTMAKYHGTLAATRSLGASGVPVTIADPDLLAPARWSRFASRSVFCPPVQEPDRFVAWLLDFGTRSPGHVLYPTSDDVAWLYAVHRDALASRFHLYQPSAEKLYTLLNKRRLLEACAKAGVEAPQTWFVPDATALRRLSGDLPYPVLIKPQAQILFWPHAKGMVVTSEQQMAETYERFMAQTSYAPALLAWDAEVARPLIQAYFPAATDSIYNLSGFVDETSELFVVRASRKVLQRPRQLGVGLCFVEAEVNAPLAARVRALCRTVGYHGAFEAEFIEQGGRALLIDFNPRFYGQMAFDIARGLPLPLFVHHAALGRRQQLEDAVERARDEAPEPRGRVYCNRIEFAMLLRLQRLAGNMTGDDVARWRSWVEAHAADLTDAVIDGRDRRPAVVHLAAELLQYLRHPRSLFRQLASGK